MEWVKIAQKLKRTLLPPPSFFTALEQLPIGADWSPLSYPFRSFPDVTSPPRHALSFSLSSISLSLPLFPSLYFPLQKFSRHKRISQNYSRNSACDKVQKVQVLTTSTVLENFAVHFEINSIKLYKVVCNKWISHFRTQLQRKLNVRKLKIWTLQVKICHHWSIETTRRKILLRCLHLILIF